MDLMRRLFGEVLVDFDDLGLLRVDEGLQAAEEVLVVAVLLAHLADDRELVDRHVAAGFEYLEERRHLEGLAAVHEVLLQVLVVILHRDLVSDLALLLQNRVEASQPTLRSS